MKRLHLGIIIVVCVTLLLVGVAGAVLLLRSGSVGITGDAVGEGQTGTYTAIRIRLIITDGQACSAADVNVV